MDGEPSQPEAILHDLFGPEFVLPEEFYGSEDPSRLSGERALMWAVFADGVETYRRNAVQSTSRKREAFREVERWVLADDWEWACSFVNLCEMFGFDPRAVREALRCWKVRRGPMDFRRQRFRPVTLHAAA